MDMALGNSSRIKIAFIANLIVAGALIVGLPSPLLAEPSAPSAPVRLTLLGDSMMAEQPEARGLQGWGAYLDKYLPNVQVTDLASSGRSSKSFMLGDMQTNGTIRPPLKWPKVLATPADYWLISFGGNDPKPGFRHTDPFGSYTTNLMTYINEARKRGITPVLITPTHHPRPKNGSPEPLAPYAEAVRQLARKENVPVMDLYDFTTQWYVKEGADVVKYQPPEYGGHFNHAGAEFFAAEMARQFSKIEPRAGQPRPFVASP